MHVIRFAVVTYPAVSRILFILVLYAPEQDVALPLSVGSIMYPGFRRNVLIFCSSLREGCIQQVLIFFSFLVIFSMLSFRSFRINRSNGI